jgi:hypothetical protein
MAVGTLPVSRTKSPGGQALASGDEDTGAGPASGGIGLASGVPFASPAPGAASESEDERPASIAPPTDGGGAALDIAPSRCSTWPLHEALAAVRDKRTATVARDVVRDTSARIELTVCTAGPS